MGNGNDYDGDEKARAKGPAITKRRSKMIERSKTQAAAERNARRTIRLLRRGEIDGVNRPVSPRVKNIAELILKICRNDKERHEVQEKIVIG